VLCCVVLCCVVLCCVVLCCVVMHCVVVIVLLLLCLLCYASLCSTEGQGGGRGGRGGGEEGILVRTMLLGSYRQHQLLPHRKRPKNAGCQGGSSKCKQGGSSRPQSRHWATQARLAAHQWQRHKACCLGAEVASAASSDGDHGLLTMHVWMGGTSGCVRGRHAWMWSEGGTPGCGQEGGTPGLGQREARLDVVRGRQARLDVAVRSHSLPPSNLLRCYGDARLRQTVAACGPLVATWLEDCRSSHRVT